MNYHNTPGGNIAHRPWAVMNGHWIHELRGEGWWKMEKKNLTKKEDRDRRKINSFEFHWKHCFKSSSSSSCLASPFSWRRRGTIQSAFNGTWTNWFWFWFQLIYRTQPLSPLPNTSGGKKGLVRSKIVRGATNRIVWNMVWTIYVEAWQASEQFFQKLQSISKSSACLDFENIWLHKQLQTNNEFMNTSNDNGTLSRGFHCHRLQLGAEQFVPWYLTGFSKLLFADNEVAIKGEGPKNIYIC